MEIVGKFAELLVEPIGKQLAHLIFYNRNVKKLKLEVEELNGIKKGLQPILDDVKRSGENIIPDVLNWQVQVDDTNEKAGTLPARCWNMSRYSLSRKAKKMTQVVITLQQQGVNFKSGKIAYNEIPAWPQPFTTTTIGESNEISLIVDDVLDTLKDDKMYIVGIHGMNRADMKELASTIYRRAKADNQFEYVARAKAEEHNEREIQGEIAYFLGLLKFDSNMFDAARRHRLYSKLVEGDGKKLIILDDVCKTLNLEAIGIPFGGGEENKICKIIVTSSNKIICEKMNTQKNYKLVHTKMLLFGGHTGDLWDDKAHMTIRSLIVVYNTMGICSFQTEYDDNGHMSMSLNHGFGSRSTDDNGKKRVPIELNHPDEFLISVSGHYKSVSNHFVLHSLKFESNKQTFGPFGVETGETFTSPPDAGKINGFYVRSSGDSLDGIGIYYEPISSHTGHELRTSDFGRPGGNPFDDGSYTTIRKLEIESDNVINSIRIEYDSNGRSRWTSMHGTSRGGQKHKVQLDYPDEFIILVSGYIRPDIVTHITVIGSLTIETNRKKYGPFGGENGEFFSFPSNNIGKIVGFHGNSGWYLDRLGGYIEPFPAQNPTTLFALVGGDAGSHWDDGAAHTTIRQIILKVGHANVIVHLNVEYDKNGRSKWPAAHGDPSTLSGLEVVIKLDYPGEFLISMSGTTRVLYERLCVVSSIKFQSNRRTYGPYGDESGGDPFSTSPTHSGKIVGFQGKSGAHLDAIGAHFEPFSNS